MSEVRILGFWDQTQKECRGSPRIRSGAGGGLYLRHQHMHPDRALPVEGAAGPYRGIFHRRPLNNSTPADCVYRPESN